MAFPGRGNRRWTNTAEPRFRNLQTRENVQTPMVHQPRKMVPGKSSTNDVQLSKAANAWKPSMRGASGAKDPEKDRHHQLLGNLRSILNRLTPEKFESLTKDVLELPISTEETLKAAAQLVFEKAVSEQHFSSTYADLCRRLAEVKVPTSERGTEFVTFRQLLIHCCQAEFEKDEDEIFIRRQKELEAVHDEERRELLTMALEEDRNKAKRRSLGNVKFIGELYKQNMLKGLIIYRCLMKLLENGDEDSLEGLCKLLTTAGKNLDVVNVKAHMDGLFVQMNTIIREKRTSPRLQFLMQDVVDLRKNHWIPRREVQGPKRIGDIHKEAALEKQRELSRFQPRHQHPRADGPTRRTETAPLHPRTVNNAPLRAQQEGRRPGGAIGGHGPRAHGPTWRTETVPLPPRTGNNAPLQPQQEGRRPGGAMGGHGPRAHGPTRLNETVHLPPRTGNNAPLKPQQEGRRPGGAIGGHGPRAHGPTWLNRLHSERTGTVPLPPRTGNNAPHQPQQECRRPGGAIGGHGPRAHGPTWLNRLHSERTETVPLPPRTVIDAPCRNPKPAGVDHPEPKAPWGRWNKDQHNWRDRDVSNKTWESHRSLRESRVLDKPPRFVTGVAGHGDARPRTDVTVKQEARGHGGPSAADTASQRTNDVTKRVNRQRFTTRELRQQLDRLLQDNASDRQIRDWLETNLDEEQTASKQFVSTVVSSVCRSAIVGKDSYRLDSERLKRRVALLRTYLNDGEKQLQAVSALQELMEEMRHPKRLLLTIFDLLYEEDVISRRVFLRWEARKDADQPDGKAPALESVRLFFSWLGKEEPEEFAPVPRHGPFRQRGRNH